MIQHGFRRVPFCISKVKSDMKKHLSRIVLNKILAVLIASFTALMAITGIFVFLYAKSKTDNMISFYLDDLRVYTVSAMDRHLKNDTLRYTEYVESLVAEDSKELFTDPEYDAYAEAYFLRSLKYNESEYDEINLVDGNGIIRISTVKDYVGYDMHSGEQSAEFLCLLDGTDVFLQDLKEISYDEKSRMRYTGAALKNTKGFLKKQALMQLIGRLPAADDFVLGNLRLSNVLVHEGRLMFMDLTRCGWGNPILDLQAAISAMFADGHGAFWKKFFARYTMKMEEDKKKLLERLLDPAIRPWW